LRGAEYRYCDDGDAHAGTWRFELHRHGGSRPKKKMGPDPHRLNVIATIFELSVIEVMLPSKVEFLPSLPIVRRHRTASMATSVNCITRMRPGEWHGRGRRPCPFVPM
jgi:hypothetical protein